MTLERTTVEANNASSTYAEELFTNGPGEGGGVASETSISAHRSLVAGNSAAAMQFNGSCEVAGGIGGGLSAPTISVVSSNVVDNVAAPFEGGGCGVPYRSQGGGIDAGDVSLEHVTLTGNQAGAGAAVYAHSSLSLTASVIGESTGTSLCAPDFDVSSGGYNVLGGWCGFPLQPTDRRGVESLGLAALADHGGQTRTRLPEENGPLSVIPVGECGADPDQRDQLRPQGAACEAGAVEVAGDAEPTAAPRHPPNTFTDVPDSADLAVDWAVANGVVFDRPNHRLRSSDPLTRGDAVVLVWRLMGAPAPAPGSLDFVDVPRTASYRRALKWAVQGDLVVPVSGRFGRKFDAGQPITRYQFVQLLWSAAGRPTDDSPHQFTDVPGNFSTWVDWAAGRDVLPSTTGAFRPDRPMRRAAAVVLVHRAASNPAAWSAGEPPPTNDF